MAGLAGAGAVVRQGHLRKLKNMKRKYFVLRADTAESSAKLEYYESEKKFRAGAQPRKSVSLRSCYNITRRLDLKQRHVIALYTKEEQFCIVPDGEEDLHGWLTDILKLHHSEEPCEELLHPTQHVWLVNIQKKGLGASKNIIGLYNLCLTDKTLTLVKIKTNNNVINELNRPDRIEYSLRFIRRCGDSECFFYMEVGRQTVTGAGELWMHTDDANIAQSMHATIYHAMSNCRDDEKDFQPSSRFRSTSITEDPRCEPPARRQTYSIDSRIRSDLIANDAPTIRNRADSMPSRTCPPIEPDRTPSRHPADIIEVTELPRDEPDASGDWHWTPRIPEEPDYCEMTPRDLVNSRQQSRNSSITAEEMSGYLPMLPGTANSTGDITLNNTPSSEYQLEPARSHIVEERSVRAYSVGSRSGASAPAVSKQSDGRARAYSVGARRPPVRAAPPAASAPLLHARHHHTSTDDLMEIDFSNNSPRTHMTPPNSYTPHGIPYEKAKAVDEYVDMSPRTGGDLSLSAADILTSLPRPSHPVSIARSPSSRIALSRSPPAVATTPDGYVEMNYGKKAEDRIPSRPIAINVERKPIIISSTPLATPVDSKKKMQRIEPTTPLGSQMLFSLSLDSPMSPQTEDLHDVLYDDIPHHPLKPVREISEEGRKSPEIGSPPHYVTLARTVSQPIAAPTKIPTDPTDDLSRNPTATKWGDNKFEDRKSSSPAPDSNTQLNYASLDLNLEPTVGKNTQNPRAYSKIDFCRSEKLNTADN